jgi:hypothetical protein
LTTAKLGGKWLLCPASDIHSIITDDGETDEMIAPFQNVGIDVTGV